MIWLPYLVAPAISAALCFLYWWALRRARRSNRPYAGRVGRRPILFAGSLAVFLVAFSLPGDAVLPRMLEHVLLAFAVPPLLLLGLPRPVLVPLFERRHSRRLLQIVTRPLQAIVLFLVVLFVWYAPGLFNVTLVDAWVHILAGLTILFVAVLFWWPVIEPLPSWHPELAELGKLLYLFVGSTALKVLGFILAFAPQPIYHLPATSRPFWGLSPLEDQQGAGLLMLVAGTLVLLAAATVVCARLFAADEAAATYQPSPGGGLGVRD